MGGAPPPRSGIGVLPHFPPQRNPTCTFPPTDVHQSTTGAAPESAKKQGFRRWGIVGRSAANLCKTACRSPFCTRSCRFAAARPFRPARVPPWGAVGYPSIDLRWGWTRLLRCVAMKTTRLLVLTLVLALSAAIAAGCGSSSGSGGDDDPAALIPAGAPALRRGRRAPRRQGPQRPRGRAEEDPAHRRPRREDPAADRRQRQERRHHLQGRRRAVGRQPRRLRHHRAAQRPERRLRRGHRLHGRRQGREAAGQAEGHRQALLQGHRLPLRRQGEDGDRAHRPPRRGRHRGRPEGDRRRQGQGPPRPRPTA